MKIKHARSLGQVFLRHKGFVNKILKNIEVDGEVVCEIGGGQGILTQHLVRKSRYVYCVELDRRFVEILRNRFSSFDNIEIIHNDILNIDFNQFGKEIVVVGNIPYQISSRLIRYLVENRSSIKAAYLTLQKELAHKLSASVSGRDYSFFSCYIGLFASVKVLFNIPAIAFSPVPKVDSSFIKIEFNKKREVYNIDNVINMMKRAFTHRRKKIINALPELNSCLDEIKKIGVDPSSRPQDISIEQFIVITEILNKRKEL